LWFFHPTALVMGSLPVSSGGPQPSTPLGWLESGGRLAIRGIITYEHASYNLDQSVCLRECVVVVVVVVAPVAAATRLAAPVMQATSAPSW
jgi:hypothetical protein